MVSILLNIIVCIFRQKTHHQIQTNPIILPRYRNKLNFNLNAKIELQYSIKNFKIICFDLFDIVIYLYFIFHKNEYLKIFALLNNEYIEIDVNVVYLA